MATYNAAKVYPSDGGDKWVVANGGTLAVENGGEITHESGAACTIESGATLATENGGTVDNQAGTLFTTHVVSLTENTNITAAQSGTIFTVDATDVVATLPATADGLKYMFSVQTVSTVTGFSVSPNASDNINGATDDKDYINTAETDVRGDCLTVVGNGTTGWIVIEKGGIWAVEA